MSRHLSQIWDVGGHQECGRLGARFWGRTAGIVLIVRDVDELQLWHGELMGWLSATRQPPVHVLWQPQAHQMNSQRSQVLACAFKCALVNQANQ